MYRVANKNKSIRRYIKALSILTGVPTVHWEDNTSCISAVEDKRVIPMVKHIDISVCFLQGIFDNGIFVPNYEKYRVVPEDICTKPWSGPIIGQSNKWMTGFRFYPTSDTEHYQLMILHFFL